MPWMLHMVLSKTTLSGSSGACAAWKCRRRPTTMHAHFDHYWQWLLENENFWQRHCSSLPYISSCCGKTATNRKILSWNCVNTAQTPTGHGRTYGLKHPSLRPRTSEWTASLSKLRRNLSCSHHRRRTKAFTIISNPTPIDFRAG